MICRSLCIVVALAIAPAVLANDYRVVAVTDGDTIKVLDTNNVQHKIRLASIDAPERGQPYGKASTAELASMVHGKTVSLDVIDTDRWGRLVAWVIGPDGSNANLAMVERGAAWVYRKYNKDESLLAVEDAARAAKRGLWALQADQVMPPWEWRRTRRR